MNADLPLVVAIVGPTAVGKTSLALAVAARISAEVVSADSRQVYRGMDIGTAKPTLQERATVPHHVIDVADPDEVYTVAHYRRDALAAIAAIHGRGRLPLLVGGTGLYVRAVTEGLAVPPVPPDPAYRAALEARAAAEGPVTLYRELAAVDPEAAGSIEPRNVRRVVRALEVVRATGLPFSQQRARQTPPFRVLKVGLTLARDALYQRVDARVDRMMAAGFLEEVRRLHAAGYGWGLPSMSGLGYRQLGAYLRGECSLEHAVQRVKYDTHAYVRRQLTWFRKDPDVRWYDATDLQPVADAVAAALAAPVTVAGG